MSGGRRRMCGWLCPARGFTLFLTPSWEFLAVEHAPIIYVPADTLGHFTDVPLLMLYETFKQP